MMIHDLLDSGSDGNDDTDYSGSYVFKVFKTCDVRVNGVWRRSRATTTPKTSATLGSRA